LLQRSYNQDMETIQLFGARSNRWPGEVQEALRDLQAALGKLYGLHAPQMLLYGSYARGDANETSDVDVLLVYPAPVSSGNEIKRLGGILADLNLRYQVLISVLPANQQDLQTEHNAFWDNIRREGIAFD
jgi:uncharacterized protein